MGIIKSKINIGFNDNELIASTAKNQFKEVNIYDNTLNFFNIGFPSPAGTDGFNTYEYELTDSVSVDGIEAFIRKIEKLEPEIKKINLNLESITAMSRKKEWDTDKSELVGIHGFYRLRDAKDKTNSGFDIPEILDDYKIYHQIKEKLESTLKSSVVKFYVDRELSEVHGILREYWEFLWNDESISYAGIDVGKGKTIPFENIERLDDIEIKICNS